MQLVVYAQAGARKRNGRPAQGSKFLVSRSLMMTVGLFPLSDQRLAFAPIADGEAEIAWLDATHSVLRILSKILTKSQPIMLGKNFGLGSNL
jgi:hypothetical protein